MGFKRGIVPIALLAAVVIGVVAIASVRLFAQNVDNRPIGNNLLAGICNVNPNFPCCQSTPPPTTPSPQPSSSPDLATPTPGPARSSIPRPSCAPPSVLAGYICINPTPSPLKPPLTGTYVPNYLTTSHRLRGFAYPNGRPTSAWFRLYTGIRDNNQCKDDNSGTKIPANFTFNLGSGTDSVEFSYAVDNLSPNSDYSYCAIAENSFGKKLGNAVNFKTAP